jgi:hypothetical protein
VRYAGGWEEGAQLVYNGVFMPLEYHKILLDSEMEPQYPCYDEYKIVLNVETPHITYPAAPCPIMEPFLFLSPGGQARKFYCTPIEDDEELEDCPKFVCEWNPNRNHFVMGGSCNKLWMGDRVNAGGQIFVRFDYSASAIDGTELFLPTRVAVLREL